MTKADKCTSIEEAWVAFAEECDETDPEELANMKFLYFAGAAAVISTHTTLVNDCGYRSVDAGNKLADEVFKFMQQIAVTATERSSTH